MVKADGAAREARALALVRKVIEDQLGPCEVDDASHEADLGLDLLLSAPGGHRFAVELKSTTQRHINALLGIAARAVLQARHIAARVDASPMIALQVPVLGRRALTELGEFMARYALDVSWIVFDERGACQVRLPTLGIQEAAVLRRSAGARRSTTGTRRSLFTDLRRWLFKVMALREVETSLWAGPRGVVENPSELARVAQVSPQTAYDLVRDARARGIVAQTDQGLQIAAPRQLFELWFAHERQAVREVIPVRSLFGELTDLDVWLRQHTRARLVVGGREACRILALDHVIGDWTPELHVEGPVATLLDDLELDRCAREEAELILVPTRYTESVFRGAIERDGIHVVDPLQAALDMAFHEPRGREQADFIVDHVLGWT